MVLQLGRVVNFCNVIVLWNVNNKMAAARKFRLAFGLMEVTNKPAEFKSEIQHEYAKTYVQ